MDGERRIQRAYSFINPPGSPWHEFYMVLIPDGELTPRLWALQPGDHLLVAAQAAGFLILDELPPGRDLWLLSTGTAIGPFLSILAAGQAATRFEHLVLVHGVRFGKELTYQPLIVITSYSIHYTKLYDIGNTCTCTADRHHAVVVAVIYQGLHLVS